MAFRGRRARARGLRPLAARTGAAGGRAGERRRRSAARELFLGSGCGACHTIRGTTAPAARRARPDARRQPAGARRGHAAERPRRAAALDRTPAPLKPGRQMPAFDMLGASDLAALAAYLTALQMTAPPHRSPEPLPDGAAPPDVQRAQEERLLAAWKIPTGWRYWSAVNNTRRRPVVHGAHAASSSSSAACWRC